MQYFRGGVSQESKIGQMKNTTPLVACFSNNELSHDVNRTHMPSECVISPNNDAQLCMNSTNEQGVYRANKTSHRTMNGYLNTS
jgi:hypothetical protein